MILELHIVILLVVIVNVIVLLSAFVSRDYNCERHDTSPD
jgi:hypothetical protein